MDILTSLLGLLSLILFGLYRLQARKAARAEQDLMIVQDDKDMVLGLEKIRQLKSDLEVVREDHEKASKQYRDIVAATTNPDGTWRPGEPSDPM